MMMGSGEPVTLPMAPGPARRQWVGKGGAQMDGDGAG
jgi:hypothetical protein